MNADELAQTTLAELGVIPMPEAHRYHWHYDFVQAMIAAMDRKRWTGELVEYEDNLLKLPLDRRYNPQEVESIGARFCAHIADLRSYLALLDTLETVTHENATELYNLILRRVFVDELWMTSLMFHVAMNKCQLWDTDTGHYQGWESRPKPVLFEHLADDDDLSQAAVEKVTAESM